MSIDRTRYPFKPRWIDRFLLRMVFRSGRRAGLTDQEILADQLAGLRKIVDAEDKRDRRRL